MLKVPSPLGYQPSKAGVTVWPDSRTGERGGCCADPGRIRSCRPGCGQSDGECKTPPHYLPNDRAFSISPQRSPETALNLSDFSAGPQSHSDFTDSIDELFEDLQVNVR